MMKLITAIIREDMLDQVREALIEARVCGLTVSRVSGHGRGTEERIHRGKVIVPSLIPKIRLEIAITDDLLDTTCNAILDAAKDEDDQRIGSGKIFITDLQECIRIRTRESGNTAI